jgi:predicted nicotinamide N-methyase
MQSTVVTFLIFALGAGAALPQIASAAQGASQVTATASVEAAQKAHAAAIANCETMWDRATHMTRKEWSRTCRRVQTRLQQLELR